MEHCTAVFQRDHGRRKTHTQSHLTPAVRLGIEWARPRPRLIVCLYTHVIVYAEICSSALVRFSFFPHKPTAKVQPPLSQPLRWFVSSAGARLAARLSSAIIHICDENAWPIARPPTFCGKVRKKHSTTPQLRPSKKPLLPPHIPTM